MLKITILERFVYAKLSKGINTIAYLESRDTLGKPKGAIPKQVTIVLTRTNLNIEAMTTVISHAT